MEDRLGTGRSDFVFERMENFEAGAYKGWSLHAAKQIVVEEQDGKAMEGELVLSMGDCVPIGATGVSDRFPFADLE